MEKYTKCACHSKKPYENCCKSLHEGAVPNSPETLMRSRYSAYALHIPSYIIQTTHPASPQFIENLSLWEKQCSHFSLNTEFQQLEIFDSQEQAPVATVTFAVHLLQNKKQIIYTEKSYFIKKEGKWLYCSGIHAAGRVPFLGKNEPKPLPLTYYDDPILRKKADRVNSITQELYDLVHGMITTMDLCHGIGLAAPQVGKSLQLFLIRMPTENAKQSPEWGDVFVFINPRILSSSSESWSAIEGCLSIPTIHAEVKRPTSIRLEYTDLEGKTHEETFSGWAAKAILHEYDHLQGTLFIDHIEIQEKDRLSPSLENLKDRLSS